MVLSDYLTGKTLVLASASPRRRELFKLLNLDCIIDPPNVEETFDANDDPFKIAEDLALLKAKETIVKHHEAIVVAADTVVVLDERILGKPDNTNHAFEMLHQLAGRWHQVITGVAILTSEGQKQMVFSEKTNVKFNKLSDNEINSYIKTGRPMDKAGAYGIQDESAVFVARIEGCFYNVVGFPVATFYHKFKEFMAEGRYESS